VIHLGGEAAVVVPVSAPAATVINAACSCLAMAAQVVQEAPGGGNGAGGTVDGLGGGAGRGPFTPGMTAMASAIRLLPQHRRWRPSPVRILP